jgi:hypothetical protein
MTAAKSDALDDLDSGEGCVCCGAPEAWDSYYCEDCQGPLKRCCGLCEACCECDDDYEEANP